MRRLGMFLFSQRMESARADAPFWTAHSGGLQDSSCQCIATRILWLPQYTAIDESIHICFLAAYPEQLTHFSGKSFKKLSNSMPSGEFISRACRRINAFKYSSRLFSSKQGIYILFGDTDPQLNIRHSSIFLVTMAKANATSRKSGNGLASAAFSIA